MVLLSPAFPITDCAKADIATAGGEICTGLRPPPRCYLRPVLKYERIIANGRVVVTGYVIEERTATGGRVAVAGGVERERISTSGRVVVPGRVVCKRRITDGRVVTDRYVATERISTGGGVRR